MSEKVLQAPFSAKFPNLLLKKPKNVECRSRKYLMHAEVDGQFAICNNTE